MPLQNKMFNYKNSKVMATKFYQCTKCGNVVVKFVDSGIDVACCGQQMQELIPSTNDSAMEKHLPVVEFKRNGVVKVKIGSVQHPMSKEHHICFICIETAGGCQVRYLMPDQAPEAQFCCTERPVAVYAYCNIHGLWKTEVKDTACCTKHRCGILGMMAASLLCFVSCSCNAQKVDNSTVSDLNLDRYLGSWYEIARFDHSFERGITHAKANYALNPDGTITVTNSGIKNGKERASIGKAKVTDTAGLLRVSFFGPFYSDYRVMMLSKDYNYALVGSGNSKYLWILSRTPEIADDVLEDILNVAYNRGYDTSRLLWVEQGL